MIKRLYNAKILTMNDHAIFDGEVWIDGEFISYVGPKRHGYYKVDEEIDLEGNLIMPGFKNAHTHSAMTFLRSYADDLPLLEWLQKQVFPMEAKLQKKHIYAFTKLAIMEYLSSGVTAMFDMYFDPETVAQAAIDCGFRAVLCGGINDAVGSIEQLQKMHQTLNQIHPLISFKLGFHGEYTTSPSLLKKISALANELKEPVYTHMSESIEEVEQCIKRTGLTPTQHVDSYGVFNYGGGGFHCVHMTEEDLRIFKDRGLYVVTNPGSNVKLASGIAPLEKMDQMGIPIAIGTDGPASNNCLDLFREMFLATGLQKLQNKNAAALDALKVLSMATKQSALAMGLAKCTSIQKGNFADLVVIDLYRPNMQPLNHIEKNIVYSGSKENVKMTIVNGEILYRDGQFYIGCDERALYDEVNMYMKELS